MNPPTKSSQFSVQRSMVIGCLPPFFLSQQERLPSLLSDKCTRKTCNSSSWPFFKVSRPAACGCSKAWKPSSEHIVSTSRGKPREIQQKKAVKAAHVSVDTGVRVSLPPPPQAKELQSHLKHTGHQRCESCPVSLTLRRSTNCINPCHRSTFYIPSNEEAQLLVCHVGNPGPWSY